MQIEHPEVAQILEHSGSRPGIQRNRVTILAYISSGQNRSDTVAAVPAKSWDNFPFWCTATAAVLSKILHKRRIFRGFLFMFIGISRRYVSHEINDCRRQIAIHVKIHPDRKSVVKGKSG